MPSETLKKAEELLLKATEQDATQPLKAAELYVQAIKLLRSEDSKEGESASRVQNLISSALERFKDCERRVQQAKQQGAKTLERQDSSSHKANSGPQTVATTHGKESSSWTMASMTASLFGNSQSTTAQSHATPPAKPLPAAPEDAAKRKQPESIVIATAAPAQSATRAHPATLQSPGKSMQEALKGVDRNLAKQILDDILDSSPGITFDDIAGLKAAKDALHEAIILPARRPDLFVGIRSPPKGILLFGPPGTGKTLLAKAVATESNCKFFSLSASSLTSKWVGQAEKMVKALFAVASQLEPCVLFIDEVDSVLSARSENEHEASRRLKTEFLVQFDGVSTSADSRVIVVAATNRPQELDEAVRRRFTKRLFIPLPDQEGRHQLIKHMLKEQALAIKEQQLKTVSQKTEGYSGSDLAAMCRDAAMAPIRELGKKIEHVDAKQVRGISYQDLMTAAQSTRPSVSQTQLQELKSWNKEFGSYAA